MHEKAPLPYAFDALEPVIEVTGPLAVGDPQGDGSTRRVEVGDRCRVPHQRQESVEIAEALVGQRVFVQGTLSATLRRLTATAVECGIGTRGNGQDGAEDKEMSSEQGCARMHGTPGAVCPLR